MRSHAICRKKEFKRMIQDKKRNHKDKMVKLLEDEKNTGP